MPAGLYHGNEQGLAMGRQDETIDEAAASECNRGPCLWFCAGTLEAICQIGMVPRSAFVTNENLLPAQEIL